MKEIKTIAIAGVGVVGGCLRDWFDSNLDYEVLAYDPPKNLGSVEDLNKADVVFICTYTPYDENNGFDISSIDDVISKLKDEKIIVIKSTVLPGTTDKLQEKYPQHSFLFNPEFLTMNQMYWDMTHPARQLLGLSEKVDEEFKTKEDTRIMVESVLQLLPRAPFNVYLSAKVAEMVKVAGNSFYATKVTFANQLYDLCEKMGINYKVVKTCLGKEPMIGENHLNAVHHGKRGYAGTCLPKDTQALIKLGDTVGSEMELLKAVEVINNKIRGLEKVDEPKPKKTKK